MNPFGWIASVVKAGKRLADALAVDDDADLTAAQEAIDQALGN
jgi:hypothetical protein